MLTPMPIRLFSTISIHALRVEGDHIGQTLQQWRVKFLSTPSGWRATTKHVIFAFVSIKFLSTPSGWRATAFPPNWFTPSGISIHALRVEGDMFCISACFAAKISIHALRVEGDGLG